MLPPCRRTIQGCHPCGQSVVGRREGRCRYLPAICLVTYKWSVVTDYENGIAERSQKLLDLDELKGYYDETFSRPRKGTGNDGKLLRHLGLASHVFENFSPEIVCRAVSCA
jgi:hypothetical protein